MTDTMEYVRACTTAMMDCQAGERELVIISTGKMDREVAELHAEIAYGLGLETRWEAYRCEDGRMHDMLFIARERGDLSLAVGLIDDCKMGLTSRYRLQYELGKLLGYSLNDILKFIAGPLAKECPCDCCGGPFVPEDDA